ncbi:DUF4157 domain-containing protein [Streptomyces sp. NPDC059785]|uniref:eCIS core domain-containing protein n=1 Tax=unclassified Streptomyces TaxID=2593676 RepID=UPI003667B475
MRSQDKSSDANRASAAGPRPSRTGNGRSGDSATPLNHAVASRSPQAILALQRAAGNAAVAGLAAQEQHVHDAGCGHQQSVQRSSVDQVVRSSGSPLAAPVRQDMEARLGADFSDVRLHTDTVAQRSAAEVGARAYTSGNHVVIGAGGGDQHTLAHELTHVIQQRKGPVAGTDHGNGVRISDPSDRFEREAEATAQRVMSGPAPAVQRAPADTADGQHAHGAAPVVQRMQTATSSPPVELSLMPNATVRDMGGGFKKYTVTGPNPGGDNSSLFRGMKQKEFSDLSKGELPQGASYQGFSPTREYSEGYITNNPESGTHLVEFYRTDAANGPLPDLDTFLKNAGAGTKAESGILSTATGMTATYSQAVLSNTSKNDARDAKLEKLRTELAQAQQDVADPKKARFKKQAEKRVTAKQTEISTLEAKGPLYPAKGDAVKALNAALANGTVAWRLITFKTPA